ncbi:DUF3955 domain-containing protein [Mammaliicoccus lentus]|uniref:DUF3955 domain-containing protein n=1 Tax=Mammaliicoccus lentus TaxID=42858 RepID=UPI001C4E6896|nr:DUF3955 domain-containing protein [Mammaliicoccus lentus]MBW0766205.1 DUF3955 domain-containing protein [Mammaliicoccus lentus]
MKSLNITALFLFIVGAITIVSKSFTPEYIDSQGILHEWFFLLPIGFGIVFIALCTFVVSLLISIIKKNKINNI